MLLISRGVIVNVSVFNGFRKPRIESSSKSAKFYFGRLEIGCSWAKYTLGKRKIRKLKLDTHFEGKSEGEFRLFCRSAVFQNNKCSGI